MPRHHFCELCWARLRPFPDLRITIEVPEPGFPVLAAFVVDSLFLDMLTASKYRHFRDVGRCLAARAAARLEGALPRADLVPVPITASKRRERGFNQTEDFAEALSQRRGLAIECSLLQRCKGGRALAGRPRELRAKAVAGAFRAGAGRKARRVPRAALDGVVLVDDLVTTGSTLAECARALGAIGIPVLCGVAMGLALSTDDRIRRRTDFYARL